MFVNRYRLNGFFLKVICGLLLMLQGACAGKESFPDLGEQFAGPVGVASKDTSHFFVLNSDFDQRYNEGSILVLDREGVKVKTIPVSRLGAGLRVLDASLVVYFTKDQGVDGKVEVYDITNPEEPTLQKNLPLEDDCNPVNLVMKVVGAKTTQVLSCLNGDLYVGEVAGANSTLKKVREYGFARRAIHIDAARSLVYAFPMIDTNKIIYIDSKRTDAKTFGAEEADTPNEVPDDYESSLEALENLTDGFQYQMVVYDLAKAESEDYPLKTSSEVPEELRWVYFELKDAAGVVDAVEKEPTQNIYRTNFWDAADHPTDPDAFYVSQRDASSDSVLNSNNVIEVKVLQDPKPTGSGDSLAVPKTSDIFEFNRVYGFEGELPEEANPGAIQIQTIGGKPILLVNHYKEQLSGNSNHSFSITAKEIGGAVELKEIKGKAPDLSYYEISMMSDGRTLSPSFYGNLVQLFDVPSSSDITSVSLKTIN